MGRGRAPCCEKVGLNKGSWTPEEDMRLMAYIKKYGHGNWRALPKQAGLLRCGKSCRLRWINYLRPDIKRGNFTIDEEETIIKLHGLLGNKWSKIASCLPGRTDNEIKNVWNTHLKKRVAPKELPTNKPEEPPTSPSSTTSISCSDQGEGENKYEPKSDEKIEIPIEPKSDMWVDPSKASPSSSSSNSFATTCDNDIDELLGELPDISVEPELFEEFPGLFGSEVEPMEVAGAHRNPARNLEVELNGGGGESKGWLADLEKELDLWGASEDCQQSVGPWVEMEEDPVSSYFQTIQPSSPWPSDLLDLDPS